MTNPHYDGADDGKGNEKRFVAYKRYLESAAKRQCSPYEIAVKKHTECIGAGCRRGGHGARYSQRSSTAHSIALLSAKSAGLVPMDTWTQRFHSLMVVFRYEVEGGSCCAGDLILAFLSREVSQASNRRARICRSETVLGGLLS